MRNLYDQYDQNENRLTHALATSLVNDRRLLRSFVREFVKLTPPAKLTFVVSEQSFPGEPSAELDEQQQSGGRPDIWICCGDSWCLLIENKITSGLQQSQIDRHRLTAERRGFDAIGVLAVTPADVSSRKLRDCKTKTWIELYAWLQSRVSKSKWARWLAEYMEILESQMTKAGELREYGLTKFSGFHFGKERPYNYPEARRLLSLAMQELRKRKRLVRRLRMNPDADGRPAITGKDGGSVWDFLRLKYAPPEGNFTGHPHLSLSIERDRIYVCVTVPNSIKGNYRKNLKSLGERGFEELMRQVCQNLTQRLARDASPRIWAVQRRYRTQRSEPEIDANLEFDLRTAFGIGRSKNRRVQLQGSWLKAAYDAFSNKLRTNYQLTIGAIFPYSCKAMQSEKALDQIEEAWLACEPLINCLTHEARSSNRRRS